MLCQIPNVSNVSAKAICEVYSNMKDLARDLEKEGIDCLENIRIKTISKNDKNNEQKLRKLSKTCKENIKNFILGISS